MSPVANEIAYRMLPDDFIAWFEPKMEKLLSVIRTRQCTLDQLAVSCGFGSYQQYLSFRSVYVDLNRIG